MKITQQNIKVKDIFEGFEDKDEDGVFAYNKKLVVRPQYQREFVYDLDQSEAVLQTVLRKFPLNVMYWMENED